jgi:hypothetical protein
MRRVRITRDEKIAARFTRGNRDACWLWEGRLNVYGKPILGYEAVLRHIFEQEFGPIPAGYVLWRNDHAEGCQRGSWCRHVACVNPHHLRLVKSWTGLYERDNRKKGQDAIEGDQEDHDESGDA